MDHFWLKRILSTQIVDLLWKKLKICRNRKSTRFLSRKFVAITHAQHTQSYSAKMAILLATRGCKPDVKTPKTNGATQQNVSRVSWAWNPSVFTWRPGWIDYKYQIEIIWIWHQHHLPARHPPTHIHSYCSILPWMRKKIGQHGWAQPSVARNLKIIITFSHRMLTQQFGPPPVRNWTQFSILN